MTRAEHEALVDANAFKNAVYHVDSARYWRERKAEVLAATSWVPSTVTPGKCEANARRHEARVREIALRSEILFAQRARGVVPQSLA
jgi:hypothetical protein